MNPEQLQAIRSIPLFAAISEDKLACLRTGNIIEAPIATTLIAEGEPCRHFYALIEGEVRATRRYDRQTILMKVNKAGSYFGELMLLLDIPSLSTWRVIKATRIFRLDEEGFWRMMTDCPVIARELLTSAATRIRNVEGYTQQREKLASLGMMAAGLAHELHNPAAAARRAAALLGETANTAQLLLCRLGLSLNGEEWQRLLNADLKLAGNIAGASPLNHVARSEHERAIAQWLRDRGVSLASNFASTFATAGLDTKSLSESIEHLPPPAQSDALAWFASRFDLKLLLGQIEQGTAHVIELIKAIKSYSYMDQAPVQEVDIHEGIENTLIMLGYKLRNVTIVREFNPSIPRITAYGSELNQVWTNIIDNAIDAVNGAGRICISTRREFDDVVVEIVDNGSGIPANIQARMFEPFFTTKSVGSGTGLGLVISNAIVANRHGGEIEFDSRPGETRFRVRLPINQPALS